MAERDARVLARHLEGLEELQAVRRAMDDERLDFPTRFEAVFVALVAYSRVAQTLHALLLTDEELRRAHQDMAAATGLGPQLPLLEVADWLAARRRDGDVARDVDVTATALMVCGTADHLAIVDATVAPDAAEAAHGGVRRAAGGLLAAMGARDAAPVLAPD